MEPIARGQITLTDMSDIISQDTAPSNPTEGMLWMNTGVTPPVLMVYQGGKWVKQNGYDEEIGGLDKKVETVKTQVSEIDIELGKINQRVSSTEVTTTTLTGKVDNLTSPSAMPYQKDLTIYGESNKYYPVYIRGGNQDVLRTIKIWRSYSEKAPSDWNTSTHKGSLMLTWQGNFGGWGGAAYKEFIIENSSQYTTLLADCTRSVHSMGYTFFLRGGGETGAIYHFGSDQAINPEVYYNGSQDLVYDNANDQYDVYAYEPKTTVNTSRLESLKLAKESSVQTVKDQVSEINISLDSITSRVNNVETETQVSKNKWLVRQYSKNLGSNRVPLIDDLVGLQIENQWEVSDKADLFPTQTLIDYKLLTFTTRVYSKTSKSVALNITSDDGINFYLNGDSIGSRAGSGTTSITMNLKVGWNDISILLYEHTGGERLTFDKKLSDNVDLMSYSSADDISSRIKTAEQKITDSAIVNTVKNSQTAGKDTFVQTSTLEQTVDSITAKFSEGGGYNLLLNGDARNGATYWVSNGGGISVVSTSKGNAFQTTMPGGITYAGGSEYTNWVKLKPSTDYIYSAYIYTNVAGAGSSVTPMHFHCTTDRTSTQSGVTIIDYKQTTAATTWQRVYVHFKTINSDVWFKPFIYGLAAQTINVKEIGLYEGKVPVAYSPNHSELYDGITTINKDGIKVNSSNANTYTQMSSTGFYLKKNDGTSLLTADANGLALTGKITVTSGSNVDAGLSQGIKDQIQQGVNADSKIDNLEIGGRNLVLNSKTRSRTGSGFMPGYALSDETPSESAEYTISFDYDLSSILAIGLSLGTSSGWSGSHFTAFTPPTAKGKYVRTITLTKGSYTHFYIYVNSTATITNAKIERSNKVTDWSPAPEDIDATIATAQSTANAAQSTANSANTTATNVNNTVNSNKNKWDNAFSIASAIANGKMLYRDPSFKTGVNGLNKYANSGATNISLTRETKPADAPTTSTHAMKIKVIGTGISPGHGGFHFATGTRANAKFITKFIAKIPTGYTVNFASNATGTGGSSKWLSGNAGTGKWEEYLYELQCGSTGSFASTNFFYLSGGATPSESAPLEWWVAYATVIDTTDAERNYDDVANLVDDWKFTGQTTIDGGHIQTDTIVAGAIKANQITTNHIATAGLDASVIKAGIISADRLDANTIVSKVNGASTTISGNKITTGTITSDHITTTGITANKIKTGLLQATSGGSYLNLDNGSMILGTTSGNNYLQWTGSSLNIKANTLTIGGSNAATSQDVENMGQGKSFKTSKKSITTSGWYRVASNAGNRAHGRFIIKDTQSGKHMTATMEVGIHYGLTPKMVLTSFSAYGSQAVTKARLVYNGTYDAPYFEIYIVATSLIEVWCLDNIQESGWEKVDLVAGSIPTGYSSIEKTISASQTVDGKVDNKVDNNQTAIFNGLTNNGADQGIYLSNSKVYINGEYIKANSIKADAITVGAGTTAEGNLAKGKSFTGTGTGTVPSDGVKTIGSPYLSFGSGNSSNNGAESAYTQVDLGAVYRISESRIFFYSGDSRSYWYKIKYSSDGSTWYYAIGRTGNDGWVSSPKPLVVVTGTENPTIDKFSVPISARYIRIYANGNSINGSNHIYEWELYSNANTQITGSMISSGTIKGTNFEAGGSGSDGKILVNNASNKLIFSADKTGIKSEDILFVNDVKTEGAGAPVMNRVSKFGMDVGWFESETIPNEWYSSSQVNTVVGHLGISVTDQWTSQNLMTGSGGQGTINADLTKHNLIFEDRDNQAGGAGKISFGIHTYQGGKNTNAILGVITEPQGLFTIANGTTFADYNNPWADNGGSRKLLEVNGYTGETTVSKLVANNGIYSPGTVSINNYGRLLYFGMERAWFFEQAGSGAGATLSLRTETDAKNFSVRSADATKAIRFNMSNGGSSLIIDEGITINKNEVLIPSGGKVKWTATGDHSFIHTVTTNGITEQVHTVGDDDDDAFVVRNAHWQLGDVELVRVNRGGAKFQGTIYPHTNNTYHLGNGSNRWNTGWIELIATKEIKGSGANLVISADGGSARFRCECCPDTNGTKYLGVGSYRWHSVWSSNGTIQTSDERYKSNIIDVDDAIFHNMIKGVDVQTYVMHSEMIDKTSDIMTLELEESEQERHQLGIIAQDMAKFDGSEFILNYDEEAGYTVNNYNFTSAVMSALKHEITLGEQRDVTIANLEAKNAELEARLAKLEEILLSNN